MLSRTYFLWPIPMTPAMVWAITVLGTVCFAASEPSAFAADSAPVLVVPARSVALHVATTVPEGVQFESTDGWQLVEVQQPDLALPAQLIPLTAADGSVADDGQRLVASIPPREGASDPRRFRLEPAKADLGDTQVGFQFKDVDEKSLQLLDGETPVLVYNHGVIIGEDVPEDDPRRSRACYVHPVWGLNGEVLTDDFPDDHYHHHGVFWAWPHIGIEGQEYDLWVDRGIRQRFVQWLYRPPIEGTSSPSSSGCVGPVAGVLGVENGWFIGKQKVMIERVWLRAYKTAGDSRSIDFEFTLIPVEKPITLWGAEGKSYGGMTVRFAVRDSKDAIITVPSGPAPEDLRQTLLRWADLTHPFDGMSGLSGAGIFVHPEHPDYPPAWLTRHYGAMCVGWPGVQTKTLEPGQPVRLCYRIWIHKTAAPTDQLGQAYGGYTAATKATWE